MFIVVDGIRSSGQMSTPGSKPGIPTARCVEHVAFTVPDLDEAIAIFVDVIGAQELYRVGPFADPEGDWMQAQLDVHPRASCEVAHLRLGPNLNLELFAWQAPDQARHAPRASDPGAGHIAFFVDDMDAAAEYLARQPGVRQQGEVQTIEDGPSAGYRWLVFQAPWGLTLEIMTRPRTLPYEASTPARFFGPAPSWNAEHDQPEGELQ
jgi:catechol 2,3-dioxygenase-like lactoylglutathione lyase family enzyme